MSDEKKFSSENKISDVENQLCNNLNHISFCTCQETASSDYTTDELYLDSNDKEETMPLVNSKSIRMYRYENSLGFKTYEIPSLRIVVQGPEILNFQGTKHSPDEIAIYWKKDSRTWLWKSGNSTYRKKHKFKNLRSSFSKI